MARLAGCRPQGRARQEPACWKDARIEIHVLEGDRFERAVRSRLFPGLDLDFLVSLLDRPTVIQAVRGLRQALAG